MKARLTALFRMMASLKVAIPLLVVLTVVTIIGSLFPDPGFFRSYWYLALLGAQGVSLLFVTIQHSPSILRRKGRNALLGVIATHLGILVLIAGVIYGGYTGFRHEVKLIEGEVTLIPGLPFAIRLDELVIEEYRQEDFPRMDLDELPQKQQDSRLTLLKGGEPWRQAVAAPGRPAQVDGITLLPAISDIGWYFEVIVTDARDREKTIPVRPWSPPVITSGNTQMMVHNLLPGDVPQAEVFTIEDEQKVSLGILRADRALDIDGNELVLGKVARYTGMQIYNRPQEPVLVAGSILMFAGLVWHFYFRHRDRKSAEDKGEKRA
jgi:cytochrome c biogenesis protein ResB